MNEDYVAGFMAKCAERGIDPEALVKAAQQQGLFGKALQSPAGQGALRFAGGVYQQIPQGLRDRVSNWASGKERGAIMENTQYDPRGYAGSGMYRDPSGSTLIKSKETLMEESIRGSGVKPSRTRRSDARITDRSPGTAAGYGRQFMGALSEGKLPTQTFKPRSPVYNVTKVHNDNITSQHLVPRRR